MEGETTPMPPKRLARHVFSRVGIAILGIIIVGLFVLSALVTRSLIQSGQLAAVISSALVTLTNTDREAERLGTLTVNPQLVAAAQAKANDMAEKGYFAHTSPEGLTPWYFIRQAGYTFAYAGENLAVNFGDSEDVTRAWMESPTHRANILNEEFTEIGIATAVGTYKGKETVFVVQMFGTPRAGNAETPADVSPESLLEESEMVREEEDADILGLASGTVETPPEEVVTEEVVPPLVSAVTEEAPYPKEAAIVVTSPETGLRALYIVCALFILIALILATRLELKRHHTPHAVAALALLFLMVGLFTVADWLIFSHPIVGEALASL